MYVAKYVCSGGCLLLGGHVCSEGHLFFSGTGLEICMYLCMFLGMRSEVCMYQDLALSKKLSEIDVAKYVCNIVARLKSLAYHFPGRTQI